MRGGRDLPFPRVGRYSRTMTGVLGSSSRLRTHPQNLTRAIPAQGVREPPRPPFPSVSRIKEGTYRGVSRHRTRPPGRDWMNT
jgi:hypothetical protein